MQMTSDQREIQRLRGELEQTREQLRQMEELYSSNLSVPPDWGLTDTQGKIFALLAKRGAVTHEQLFHQLYALRNDVPEEKIICVMICKIRQKMAAGVRHWRRSSVRRGQYPLPSGVVRSGRVQEFFIRSGQENAFDYSRLLKFWEA